MGNQETIVTVAVGDTFLFSPLVNGKITKSSRNWRFPQTPDGSSTTLFPFLYDSVCVTHNIPYFRAFIGSGIEEEYHRLIQYCSKTSLS
jgi:hypothetical protein